MDPYMSNKQVAQNLVGQAEYWKQKYEEAVEENSHLKDRIHQMGPCDRCRFNPPSSCDGKPCCMCVAEKIIEEEEDNETC